MMRESEAEEAEDKDKDKEEKDKNKMKRYNSWDLIHPSHHRCCGEI